MILSWLITGAYILLCSSLPSWVLFFSHQANHPHSQPGQLIAPCLLAFYASTGDLVNIFCESLDYPVFSLCLPDHLLFCSCISPPCLACIGFYYFLKFWTLTLFPFTDYSPQSHPFWSVCPFCLCILPWRKPVITLLLFREGQTKAPSRLVEIRPNQDFLSLQSYPNIACDKNPAHA